MPNHQKMRIFACWVLTIALIGFSVLGCTATPERYHPEFSRYRKSMDTLLVLAPEIAIFEQMPDGSRLFRDIQSREAQGTALQSIVNELSRRHFTVHTADDAMMRMPEIRSVASLFRSVNRSIQLHTFGPQIYPSKLGAFEYSVGKVDDILKIADADGLVLAIGYQTGSDQPAKNWLSIAVVEPQGHIIWYGVQGDHLRYNFHQPQSLAALVTSAMARFWESGS